MVDERKAQCQVSFTRCVVTVSLGTPAGDHGPAVGLHVVVMVVVVVMGLVGVGGGGLMGGWEWRRFFRLLLTWWWWLLGRW